MSGDARNETKYADEYENGTYRSRGLLYIGAKSGAGIGSRH
jgi:hypothetical protein